jgi:hypothetical protein
VDDNVSLGGAMAGAGGVANGGTATITWSEISYNRAPGAPGGGLYNHGTATLNGSRVDFNTALTDPLGTTGNGGGIANVNTALLEGVPHPPPSGVLTLNNTQVEWNSASALGGGIADVGINTDGTPTAPAGPLTLTGSVVTRNTAGLEGGGIVAVPGSPVWLTASKVKKNTPDNCFPPGVVSGCVG